MPLPGLWRRGQAPLRQHQAAEVAVAGVAGWRKAGRSVAPKQTRGRHCGRAPGRKARLLPIDLTGADLADANLADTKSQLKSLCVGF